MEVPVEAISKKRSSCRWMSRGTLLTRACVWRPDPTTHHEGMTYRVRITSNQFVCAQVSEICVHRWVWGITHSLNKDVIDACAGEWILCAQVSYLYQEMLRVQLSESCLRKWGAVPPSSVLVPNSCPSRVWSFRLICGCLFFCPQSPPQNLEPLNKLFDVGSKAYILDLQEVGF